MRKILASLLLVTWVAVICLTMLPDMRVAVGQTLSPVWRLLGVEDQLYGSSVNYRVFASGDTLSVHGVTPYNVLAYGVDNTGATDCSDSLQAVIDLVEADGGGVVYMPEGTYLLSAGITIDSDGVCIVGDGRATIIKQDFASYQGDLITISSADNCTFADFYLSGATDSTKYIGSGNGRGFDITTPSDNIVFRNLKVDSCALDGIYVGASSGYSTNILIEGCEISDCNRDGIAVIAGEGVRILGNHIYDNWGIGIDVEPNVATNIVRGLIISDNYLENSRITPVIASSDTFYVRLLDVTSNAGLTADVENVVVEGNVFERIATSPDAASTQYYPAVYIADIGNLTFSNNITRTNLPSTDIGYGIVYLRGCKSISGHGNSVSYIGTNATGLGYGVYRGVWVGSEARPYQGNVNLGFTIKGNVHYGLYGVELRGAMLNLSVAESDSGYPNHAVYLHKSNDVVLSGSLYADSSLVSVNWADGILISGLVAGLTDTSAGSFWRIVADSLTHGTAIGVLSNEYVAGLSFGAAADTSDYHEAGCFYAPLDTIPDW